MDMKSTAFEKLNTSLATLGRLESNSLPRISSKSEWQGKTRLPIYRSPWRPKSLRTLDSALRDYHKVRVIYERRAASNAQKLQRLVNEGADVGGTGWQAQLAKYHNLKRRELATYDRAIDALAKVTSALEHWSTTKDYKQRANKRGMAVGEL